MPPVYAFLNLHGWGREVQLYSMASLLMSQLLSENGPLRMIFENIFRATVLKDRVMLDSCGLFDAMESVNDLEVIME